MLKSFLFLIIIISFAVNAPAQTDISEEFKADIELLFEKTNATELGIQFASSIMQQLNGVLKSSGSTIPDTVLSMITEESIELMKEEMEKEGGLVSMLVFVYAKYFNHEEIKELNKFYDTAIGKKTVKVMGQIMQESMLVGRAWGETMGPKMVERIAKRLEELGYDASPLKKL